ncbi:hypothetical protein KPSA3_00283 [Pseudomonas syringae pv. actinidiae]|uniref:Uncharacterized protein n=1 Tax=Pseudomonas syringae pv. actinidiae TaxID=103796 RepID=A0AAN4PZU5_PSESF|nr:hypothetical protein KPSA3_00283 [Pseudomonas syringae pv. actinidiae]
MYGYVHPCSLKATLQPLCQNVRAVSLGSERVSHSCNYLSNPDCIGLKSTYANDVS